MGIPGKKVLITTVFKGQNEDNKGSCFGINVV